MLLGLLISFSAMYSSFSPTLTVSGTALPRYTHLSLLHSASFEYFIFVVNGMSHCVGYTHICMPTTGWDTSEACLRHCLSITHGTHACCRKNARALSCLKSIEVQRHDQVRRGKKPWEPLSEIRVARKYVLMKEFCCTGRCFKLCKNISFFFKNNRYDSNDSLCSWVFAVSSIDKCRKHIIGKNREGRKTYQFSLLSPSLSLSFSISSRSRATVFLTRAFYICVLAQRAVEQLTNDPTCKSSSPLEKQCSFQTRVSSRCSSTAFSCYETNLV